jgi:hypothetical protein
MSAGTRVFQSWHVAWSPTAGRGAASTAVVLAISHSSTAHAVEVRVCITVDNDPILLWDYSPTLDGRDALDDFGRLDQPNALRVPRILTRIRSNGATIWGWAPVGNDGCTPVLDIDAGAPIETENYWWSYFSDSDVSVVSLDCPQDDSDCTTAPQQIDMQVAPPNGGIIEVELDANRRSYVHFAAAFAESRTPTSSPAGTEYYTRTGIPLDTHSNRFAGGKPTANLGEYAFARKFTVAHEYGHLKTLVQPIPGFSNADVDYCYGDGSCSLTHTLSSNEWQAAAAIEGFADFYAMSVWNDLDGSTRDGILVKAQSASAWECRYQPDPNMPDPTLPDDCVDANSPLTVVADSWHYQLDCSPDNCPAGVAVQSDWTFALWDMRLNTSAQLPILLNLLSAAYPWPINGENQLYWNNFVNAANVQLTQIQLNTWLGIANIRGIDR